jgi:hypothetical protein
VREHGPPIGIFLTCTSTPCVHVWTRTDRSWLCSGRQVLYAQLGVHAAEAATPKLPRRARIRPCPLHHPRAPRARHPPCATACAPLPARCCAAQAAAPCTRAALPATPPARHRLRAHRPRCHPRATAGALLRRQAAAPRTCALLPAHHPRVPPARHPPSAAACSLLPACYGAAKLLGRACAHPCHLHQPRVLPMRQDLRAVTSPICSAAHARTTGTCTSHACHRQRAKPVRCRMSALLHRRTAGHGPVLAPCMWACAHKPCTMPSRCHECAAGRVVQDPKHRAARILRSAQMHRLQTVKLSMHCGPAATRCCACQVAVRAMYEEPTSEGGQQQVPSTGSAARTVPGHLLLCIAQAPQLLVQV